MHNKAKKNIVEFKINIFNALVQFCLKITKKKSSTFCLLFCVVVLKLVAFLTLSPVQIILIVYPQFMYCFTVLLKGDLQQMYT